MLSEQEWVYERWRLYEVWQAHPEWSLRSLARSVAHDLRWVRKWLARFQADGVSGLECFQSRSRRPKKTPKGLKDAVKDQVCSLRESLSERFHRPAGAETIQYFLKSLVETLPCAKSIYRILRERGYLRTRPAVKPSLLDLPGPMEEWEMDFGEIYLGPTEGSLECFLVVDRGTSRVIYLEGSSGYTAERALEAVMRLFAAHGLPQLYGSLASRQGVVPNIVEGGIYGRGAATIKEVMNGKQLAACTEGVAQAAGRDAASQPSGTGAESRLFGELGEEVAQTVQMGAGGG